MSTVVFSQGHEKLMNTARTAVVAIVTEVDRSHFYHHLCYLHSFCFCIWLCFLFLECIFFSKCCACVDKLVMLFSLFARILSICVCFLKLQCIVL